VGIGTTNPTAGLDVDGTLRVRSTPGLVNGKHLVVDKHGNVGVNNNYNLILMPTTVAPSPKVYVSNTKNSFTENNINLGLIQSVTIPSNKQAKVIVTYSMPLGTKTNNVDIDGYIGVRFLKDGVEKEAGSRKYNLNEISGSTYQMSTLTSIFTEEIITGNTDLTIEYSLDGYIEQYSTSKNVSYIFNMWSSSPPNYNWGRAVLSIQVFAKEI
jgi:hypothetical protein